MNLFNKAIASMDVTKECFCDNNSYLVIDRTTTSRMIAGLLFAFLTVFIAGYYLGKYTIVKEFSSKLEQDSFADHINYAVSTLYDTKNYTIAAADDSDSSDSNDSTSASSVEETPCSSTTTEVVAEIISEESANSLRYYATLLGGPEKFVRGCYDRLKKAGIETVIAVRPGKTGKGKKIQWYQLITQEFTDKGTLEKMVEKITSLEKLHNVTIVTQG